MGDSVGCWRGIRAFRTSNGGRLNLRGPFTRPLRRGARVYVRVQLDQHVRTEFRLRFRRGQGPSARITCGRATDYVLPAVFRPVSCPAA